jgi:membrane-bound lytic murein transglycosylase A
LSNENSFSKTNSDFLEESLISAPKRFSFSTKSRFRPSNWNDLPGFSDTSTSSIWASLLDNCLKPHPIWINLCKQMRPMTMADEQEQRIWILSELQPFRVESLEGEDSGILTSYFEPVFNASLTQRDTFNVPIFSPPPGLISAKKLGQPWFSRREIETLPNVQVELQNHAIAWLQDPLDAMILHVQGSARLRIEVSPSQWADYRVGFSASNDLPYQSIAKWFLDQGLTKDISWEGIKNVLQKNPGLEKESFWSNPRYIFFAISPLSDPSSGPRGALGVPLKANLSIAVDPKSIPLGMPLWLDSTGSTQLKQLTLSQDTGNAINGPIRADYFAGSGSQAGEFANKIKQNLKLWLILPRSFTQ